MISKHSLLMVSALGLGLGMGLLAGGCGGVKDLCKDKRVVCDGALSCDPTDGVCKCGGRGGVVCDEKSVCDGATNTCLSTRCGTKDCRGNTSCDQNDGQCKCGGTGGTVCTAEQVCDAKARQCVAALDCTQVACRANEVCDTQTRSCRCGTATCGADEYCASDVPGGPVSCKSSKCLGVSCAPGNVCDPSDGYCKCNGSFCGSGQACLCPVGAENGACQDSQRLCRTSTACQDVTCTGNAVCDPADGKCKCGGPGGPRCGAGQVCNTPGGELQCQGGEQCKNEDGSAKVCAGGTSCDPEDGKCKCGGRGGIVCAAAGDNGEPASVCVSTSLQQTCFRPCVPHAADCPSGTFCFFNPLAATPVAYCAEKSDTQIVGNACTTATSCFDETGMKSLACVGLATGTTGICRDFCDVAAGRAGCPQVPTPQTCEQIPTAPAGYGYCRPQ